MKGIFKLMTAALAVGTLASCSDELDVQKAAQQARQQADLIGHLNASTKTRVGIQETAVENGRLADYELRWTEGDQVRVFSLDAMTYNTYLLDPATAGTSDGAFSKTQDFKPVYDGKLYALTEGQFVYAVSPDADGDPLLTMTIPASYDMDEDLLKEKGINKFPAPFWGEATVDGDEATGYKLDATFNALTSFLRLDLRTLPVGTKAIVLTTHGSRTSHMPTGLGSEVEGYQLAATAEDVYARTSQTTAFTGTLTRDDFMKWYNSGKDFVNGGKSEPLSGALSGKLVDGAQLAHLGYSNILVSGDTIRVNLQNIPEEVGTGVYDEDDDEIMKVQNDDKIIYIPIVAGTYHNLHVIAVTEDSPFSYQWIGQEIEKYTDEEFKVNTIKQLVMKVNVDVSDCYDWEDLSQAIYGYSKQYPGRVLNIDIPEDIAEVDGTLYIDNTMTRNDLILNWPENEENYEGVEFEIQERTAANVKMDSDDPNKVERMSWHSTLDGLTVPIEAERYITLNIDPLSKAEYTVTAPSSVVTIGTTDGMNNAEAKFQVLTAKENLMVPNSTLNDATVHPGVSGLDLLSSSDRTVTMNRKNATVIVKNGIGSLDIVPQSLGDVYVYSGGYQETEIANYLAIRTTNAVKTRLTDALVKNIWVVNSESLNRYVFTTGSSAIGYIKTLTNPVGEIRVAEAPTTVPPVVFEADAPKRFHVVAYWTGAALQPAAIEKYDKAYVYTAAQLASVGENTQAVYAIPEGVVTEMWLGGEKYPWIGADVKVAEFKFDGRRVSLQNMTLEIGDASFIDPHHCCTSCGDLRKINLTENLGLFRSIKSETSAELDSINLNDVYLTTEEPINNIGSIAGLIESPKVTMTKNQVGEVKINVNGSNIGGMAGRIQAKNNGEAELTMTDNSVTKGDDSKNTGWIISKKDNVGGQIGSAKVSKATIEGSVVDLKDQITAGSLNIGNKQRPVLVSRVGGIVGYMEASDAVKITKPAVSVVNQIRGDEQMVGGIAGFINGESTVAITDGKVETKLIQSNNAGLVGGGAGLLLDNGSTVTGNTVKADNILAKTNYVGGVAGRLDDGAAKADFSGNTVAGKTGTKVTIKTDAENAGGLIGLSSMTLGPAVLTIEKAAVTAALIEATEGYAGGEIGNQADGVVKIGKEAADAEFNTAIAVDKLSGAYGLGGLVGANEDVLYVYSNVKDAANKKWSKIELAIADWETKKNEAYYEANNETDHRAGTMSNIVGYLGQKLYVYETPNYLTVTDALTSAKKTALFFKTHKNRQYTTDETGFYWGDQNGYVGWGHSGNYFINSNGQNADQTGKYNLYKPASVYDTTKSKWQ